MFVNGKIKMDLRGMACSGYSHREASRMNGSTTKDFNRSAIIFSTKEKSYPRPSDLPIPVPNTSGIQANSK